MQALESMVVAGLTVEGVMHVGANEGQERLEYASVGASPCIYVEPIDEVFAKLQDNVSMLPGHIAIQAVCSERIGDIVQFNIANNSGLSSSLLGLGSHADFHPTINYVKHMSMATTTIDRLIDGLSLDSVPNLLVIDTQGAELKVLKGATKTLQEIDGLYVEVCERPLYEDGCTHEDITNYLKPFNMRLRWMSLDVNGHGDAFYCRGFCSADELPRYDGNIALCKPSSQSSQSAWSVANDAQGAVNGKKTGGFSFHTEVEDNPWWQVDLRETSSLREIRIFNRLSAGRARSRTLQAFISATGDDWQLVHDQGGRAFGGVDGRPLRIKLSAKARFVRLQLNERNYLHLDEVEIY